MSDPLLDEPQWHAGEQMPSGSAASGWVCTGTELGKQPLPAVFSIFVRQHAVLDSVEEADELLMVVVLHVLSNVNIAQHIEGGKERRQAMALLVAGLAAPARPISSGRLAWFRASA